jgi:large subunit ribosomal protein L25
VANLLPAEASIRPQGAVMAVVKLAANPRNEFGKGASRRLRSSGQVPVVVYGQGGEAAHYAVDAHDLGLALRDRSNIIELDIAGKGVACGARDVQKDYIRNSIKHVDLVLLTPAEVAARS